MTLSKPPGRLGDLQMAPGTDPRINPALLEALKVFKLDASSIPDPKTIPAVDAPIEDIMSFAGAAEEGMGAIYGGVNYDIPALASSINTTRTEETITTEDGYEMKLIIYRPSSSTSNDNSPQPLPALLYFHGGGMTILKTDNYIHTTWLESLARAGFLAIAADFRNAYTSKGHNPFPTGLNDCAAAVKWLHAHRQQHNISKILIQGESGGGNLTLATALKARREGWLNHIDAVIALSPYISGAYGSPDPWKLTHLPSLVECDGYFISTPLCALLARLYDPTGEHAQNPLAWPYWASIDTDLKGLPPHLILVNELDPLRDEGAAYARKLLAAGVTTVAKMNLGIVHGGEILLRHAVPDLFLAEVAELKAFADRV